MNKSNYSITSALAAGRACLGVPYEHQGRDPLHGLDCSGLMLHMMHAGGWVAKDPHNTYATDYSKHGSWRNIERGLNAEGYRIELKDLQPMDLVLVHWVNTVIPQHFAMVTRNDERGLYIIHTHHSFMKVAEHGMDEELMDRVHSLWRFYGWVNDDPLAPISPVSSEDDGS